MKRFQVFLHVYYRCLHIYTGGDMYSTYLQQKKAELVSSVKDLISTLDVHVPVNGLTSYMLQYVFVNLVLKTISLIMKDNL